MEKLTLGLIGGGFIGSAFARVFNHYTDVKVFDLLPEKRTHSLQEVLDQDILIVAVNTPMKKDGSADITAIRNALEMIRSNTVYWKPVIVKSTIPPDLMGELIEEFNESLYLVFSPEFLTERTAEYDLQQSTRFIFGVADENLSDECVQKQMIDHLFSIRFPAVPRYWVSYRTASLVKYFTNGYFANKISLFNEYKQIADEFRVDWHEVISLTMLDPRIGRSHFQVPGHDGKAGFGGHCFLKDVNALRYFSKARNLMTTVIDAIWRKNVEVRGAKNLSEELNKMIGRASKEQFNEKDVLDL